MPGDEIRLKLTKSWEGDGPFLVLFVSAFGGGATRKLYLTIDANQKTRGIRSDTEKRLDLKPSGGVVAQLRKHAATGGLGGIWQHEESGDLFVPIYTHGGDHAPDAYVELKVASPPEICLILADGTVLVRKSSQGTFTKKRTFVGTMPLSATQAGFRDVTREILADAPEPEESLEERAPGDGGALLPEHQRDARSRLARKLKTVRKYAQKAAGLAVSPAQIDGAERDARLLRDNLFRVHEGDAELTVDGVTIPLSTEATPGHNLDLAFTRVKKLRRGAAMAQQEIVKATAQVQELERELERLRTAPLPPGEVTAILARFKILPVVLKAPKAGLVEQRAMPFRRVAALGVEFLVGKGSAENDELTKAARGNDWWFHAVGMTGSHVILPARTLKGGMTPEILRGGCILALHNSKARDNLRGEVYVTQKRHLRKTRGLAVGLWLVQQAETMFVSYQPEEAQRLIDGSTSPVS